MQARNKALLLALGLSALLLLSAVPAAEASRSGRTLTQWSDSWSSNSWSGWGWGSGWGNPWWGMTRPSDPVGSGCWDGATSVRYRHGESQYCSGGGSRRCNWGEWEGSCGSSWDSWTRRK